MLEALELPASCPRHFKSKPIPDVHTHVHTHTFISLPETKVEFYNNRPQMFLCHGCLEPSAQCQCPYTPQFSHCLTLLVSLFTQVPHNRYSDSELHLLQIKLLVK